MRTLTTPLLAPAAAAAILGAGLAACGGDAAPAPCRRTGAGTTHAAALVTEDTVFGAADGPHRIAGALSVLAGATLTIEPCTDVILAAGARIELGAPGGSDAGHLVAEGTAESPIRFRAAAGGAPWAALMVFAPGSATLADLEIEGGGAPTDFGAASLVVLGDGTVPSPPPVTVRDVVVRGSRGDGVLIAGGAAFAPGSSGLTVEGAAARPLVAGQHALHGLPTGRYTGNGADEILVVEDNANARSGLQTDATLRALGVPYRIGRAPDEGLRVGANGGVGLATLTIEAGVELRFSRGTSLRVVSDADAPRGRLVIRGRADAPVVLTSAEPAPAPGDWTGLYFESPMAEHAVEHARIAYAGGPCACTLASCSPLAAYEAAVILDGLPPSAFVRDSTLVASAGHGFLRSFEDHPELDFLAANTVEDAAGCPQTEPVHSDEVCPDPAFDCMP